MSSLGEKDSKIFREIEKLMSDNPVIAQCTPYTHLFGHHAITLDGIFTLEQLKKIVEIMEE